MKPLRAGLVSGWVTLLERTLALRPREAGVALASRQPWGLHALHVIGRLSSLLVIYSGPRGFPPDASVFPSP